MLIFKYLSGKVENMEVNSLKIMDKEDILNLFYPVGSVYTSMNNIDPSNLFGGTWKQIKDKFLLSVGDTYTTVNKTGGEATHTLAVNEIPSHNHTFSNGTAKSAGAHSHSVYASATSTKGSNQNRVCSSDHDSTSFGTSSAGAHTHTVTGTIGNTGSGQAHNNMPPYLTVYMWERTA